MNRPSRFRAIRSFGLIAAAVLAGAPAPLAAAQAGPVSPDGWTVLQPSADSRIVFVSITDGVSAGNARWYSPSDPEIGGDPFNPSGPIVAYASINEAYEALRDGKPDWILLKRGDVWQESFNDPKWTKSGRGPGEYMVVGTYGPSQQRPQILGFETRYGQGQWIDRFDYVAVVGIQFNRAGQGLDRRIGGNGFLVEDCYFKEAVFDVQGFGPILFQPYLTNLEIRRCIMEGNYDPSGHAQNLYVAMCDGVLIEECVFDRGGWKPGVDTPDMLSHNAYIQSTTINVTFRNNISARPSSHGVQMRRGGICENNLFLENPIGVQIGSSDLVWPAEAAGGAVFDNVFLDSRDIDVNPRGMAIWCDNVDGVEIFDNILAHQVQGSLARGMSFGNRYRNIHVHDNILYDWAVPGDPNHGAAITVYGTPLGTNNRLERNIIQQPGGGRLQSVDCVFTAFSYSDHTYFSTNLEEDWFRPGESLAEWTQLSGETGATAEEVAFNAPQRDITTYMQSIGMSGGVIQFMAQARQQSRFNWRNQFTAQAVNDYIRAGFQTGGGGGGGGDDIELTDVTVVHGSHVSGGINQLRGSDNSRYIANAAYGFSAMEPWLLQVRVGAVAGSGVSGEIDIDFEGHASVAGAIVQLQPYDWLAQAYVTAATAPLGMTDTFLTVDVPVSRYRRASDGRVEMRVQVAAVAVFSALGFEGRIDQIEFEEN